MSGTPFFSVIIPTFNRADLLAKAIQSVLDQTFTDWELIVIDDGSTDHTASLVKSFEDERIGYYFKQNEERSAARNFGIEQSKGLFLSFLDDDDYYLSDFLSENQSVIAFENTPICAVLSNEYTLNNGKLVPGKILSKYQNNPVRMLWVMQSSIRPFVIHREILEKEKFDERFKYGEDGHLLIRISLKYPILILDKRLTVYVVHPGSGTQKKFLENIKENATLEMEYIEDLFLQHPEINELITSKEKSDLINHKVYGFASAAMKILDFKLFGELVEKLELKGTLYRVFYYLISLYARLPWYYIQIYFKYNWKR